MAGTWTTRLEFEAERCSLDSGLKRIEDDEADRSAWRDQNLPSSSSTLLNLAASAFQDIRSDYASRSCLDATITGIIPSLLYGDNRAEREIGRQGYTPPQAVLQQTSTSWIVEHILTINKNVALLM